MPLLEKCRHDDEYYRYSFYLLIIWYFWYVDHGYIFVYNILIIFFGGIGLHRPSNLQNVPAEGIERDKQYV